MDWNTTQKGAVMSLVALSIMIQKLEILLNLSQYSSELRGRLDW